MKKHDWYLAMSLMLLGGTSVALAQLDDARGTPASTAVQFLIDEGIVEGYDDGTFKPDQAINRAEFLKIVLASGAVETSECELMDIYEDVTPKDWFYDVVCTATVNKIVEGYPDGTFRPGETINLAEASKIVAKVNALKTEQTDSTEAWYQPFVRALQIHKVLANSIGNVSQRLNRGEMAQMVWGLSTGNEVNEELNDALPKIASCPALQTEIERFQKRQSAQTGLYRRGMEVDFMMAEPEMMMDDMAVRAESSVAAPAAANIAKATSDGGADRYSTTNIQEFGVDEADIIKNDGQYIYLIKNDTIKVVEAFPPKELKTLATIRVDEKGFYPQEMYVDGDTLTVIGQTNQYYAYDDYPIPVEGDGGIGDGAEPLPEFWEDDAVEIEDSVESGGIIQNRAEVAMVAMPGIWPGNNKTMTTLVAYDISDRSQPKLQRTVSLEGNYQSSRKIGEVVYLVANKYNNWYWGRPVPMLKDIELPMMSDSADSSAKLIAPCNDIYYYPNFETPNYLTVAAINTEDTSEKVGRLMMLGSGEQLYSSAENMYVTRTRYDDRFIDSREWTGWRYEPTTQIYKFALDGTDIDFVATGKVRGRVLNQFSMSEAGSFFRIATQTDGEAGSMMTILNDKLVETGSVDGIAPGENIKAVRFMGDKAYMITFENVDPLFVIDLDPENPKVLGELKIPGWSDYLHPYDDTHLMGIGREVKEGADADGRLTSDELLGLKLAIYDVSDLSNPKEIHKKVIGDNGSSSEATYNHKAFLFDPEEHILALPLTVMQQVSENVYDRNTVFQGAFIYDVDLIEGFKLRGKATHYADDYWNADSANTRRWGNHEYDIQRILYIGDYWFTVSPNVVAAYNWDDVSKVSQITLEQKACTQIYDGYECEQQTQCRTIWREWSECYTDDEDFSKVCEEQREFSRCEAK